MEFKIKKIYEPRKFTFQSKSGQTVEKFVSNLETSQGKISYFFYAGKSILKEGDTVEAEVETKDTSKDGVTYHNVSIKSISKVNGKEVSMGGSKMFDILNLIYSQNKEILGILRPEVEPVKPPLGPSVIKRSVEEFKKTYGTMPDGVELKEEPPEEEEIGTIPF